MTIFVGMCTRPCFDVFLYIYIVLMLAPTCELTRNVELRGAGASFPRDVYDAWILSYKSERSKFVDLDMTYEGVGSGNGRARILGKV